MIRRGWEEEKKLGQRMERNGGGGGGVRRVFDSVEELATGLAEHVALVSEASVRERGAFSLVLSGGADLLSLLSKLAGAPYSKTVDWSRWHVFWAEENAVPRNHPHSHYRLAKEIFLSKVPIVPSKVVPAVAAAASASSPLSAEKVAEDYEFRLRQLVRSRAVDVSRSTDCPRFDLILLLLGPDGRVASLYPDHPSLGLGDGEQCPWVAPVRPPSPPHSSSSSRWSSRKETADAVTMTLPVINAAAEVVIVATGSCSVAAPANMVSPTSGNLVWFVDAEAAASLSLEG